MTSILRTASLLLLAAVLAMVAAWRLDITYDLAYFLPKPTTAAQRILIERLGQGPGTQIVYVVLPEATAIEADAVGQRLRELRGIRRVYPQAEELDIGMIPAPAWQHRFLLADLPEDEAAWREIPRGAPRRRWFGGRRSSTGLDRRRPAAGQPRRAEQLCGRPCPTSSMPASADLLVQTTVPAFDIGSQTKLVEDLRAALDRAGFAPARLYGAGVYGVDVQAAVRLEATAFSALASIALACLLFWRFRSVAVVVAIGAPMLAGAAAGLCALALIYTQVHGIVLAFGFTLLGVVVDYPLHLFSHRSGRNTVWPTLRIGVGSTLAAYAAFLLGGSAGIEQLGLFAIVGIGVAALGAAWLVPGRASKPDPVRPAASAPLRHWPWIAVLLLAAPFVLVRTPFSDNLAALTPLPKATLAEDAELRRRMGSNDMGHVIVVRGTDLDTALAGTERVAEHLDAAVEAAELAGYTSIAPLLPSQARQRQRQEALRQFAATGAGSSESSAFAKATADMGFAAAAFQPFQDAALAAAATPNWLTYDDLVAAPELAPLANAHLLETDDAWVSLVFLRGLGANVDAIAARLATLNGRGRVDGMDEGVELVDLKNASLALMATFRERLLAALGTALLVIGVMLLLLTRSPRRTVWLLGTIAAAVVVSTSFGAWLRDGLSLFDIVALALVAGLGLDYGLFYSRASVESIEAADTRRAVFICALSSILVFGILAFSTTPALHGIGATVAVGVAVAYVLARLGCYGHTPLAADRTQLEQR